MSLVPIKEGDFPMFWKKSRRATLAMYLSCNVNALRAFWKATGFWRPWLHHIGMEDGMGARQIFYSQHRGAACGRAAVWLWWGHSYGIAFVNKNLN